MSALSLRGLRGLGWLSGPREVVGGFWSGVSAVSIKELRGRMRGRRAFVILTLYLALLSIFAWAIFQFLRETQASPQELLPGFGGGISRDPGTSSADTSIALSARVGQGIFSGLLLLETLLVLVLAPAFTSGAISMEREKQTLDLLATTPLSTFGMVIGKLFSALIYVLLLVVASIPLASLVFTFGGVAPDDLLRGYVLLFALCFGMGAIGLFFSALARRTQVATVLTYVTVLALTLGSYGVFRFWHGIAGASAAQSGFIQSQSALPRPPQQLLWLNPVIADFDIVCGTAAEGYDDSCAVISWVTNKPYFGTFGGTCLPGQDCAEPPAQVDGGPGVNAGGAVDVPVPGVVGLAPPGRDQPLKPGMQAPIVAEVQSFGFPRDTFWPRTALAFTGLGLLLTFLSAQLVTPTRRLAVLRPANWSRARRPETESPVAPADGPPPDEETDR